MSKFGKEVNQIQVYFSDEYAGLLNGYKSSAREVAIVETLESGAHLNAEMSKMKWIQTAERFFRREIGVTVSDSDEAQVLIAIDKVALKSNVPLYAKREIVKLPERNIKEVSFRWLCLDIPEERFDLGEMIYDSEAFKVHSDSLLREPWRADLSDPHGDHAPLIPF